MLLVWVPLAPTMDGRESGAKPECPWEATLGSTCEQGMLQDPSKQNWEQPTVGH